MLVVEANSRVGGRVCQDVGWGDWGPIDLGAEFVHGSNTTIYRLANDQGWPLTSCVYVNNEAALQLKTNRIFKKSGLDTLLLIV